MQRVKSAAARRRFASFREFYPYYLAEHRDRRCRRLHVIGSTLVLAAALAAAVTLNPWWLLLMPVCGYGCAWAGHYFFEHNRPATFSHPWYSLMGDWVMYASALSGRLRF